MVLAALQSNLLVVEDFVPLFCPQYQGSIEKKRVLEIKSQSFPHKDWWKPPQATTA